MLMIPPPRYGIAWRGYVTEMEKKNYSIIAMIPIVLLAFGLVRDVLEAIIPQLPCLPFDIRLRLGIHHT